MGPHTPLSLSRGFTVEQYSRAIDRCQDIEELRSLSKLLLKVWQQQAYFNEYYGSELLQIKGGDSKLRGAS